jgi:predicted amidophosphoribosyltransferase
VITTGSTTQELRSLLMAVGVAQVDVWAAAQVP